MKFIIAEKLEMTQIYKDAQRVIPVTKVRVNPCIVTQLKTQEQDGYESVQVSAGQKSKLTKAIKGHLSKSADFFAGKAPKHTKEFRVTSTDFKVGDLVTEKVFEEGDRVMVRGFSKGKGFAGVVKRHGFKGSPASHGHKDQLRMPGSIGEGTGGVVPKGKRMGGQMGNDKVLVRNLEIVKIEEGFLYIKGAVPGARGGYLEVYTEDDSKMELANFFDAADKASEKEEVQESTTVEEAPVTTDDASATSEEEKKVASEETNTDSSKEESEKEAKN